MPRLQLFLRAAELDSLRAMAQARGQSPSRIGRSLTTAQLRTLGSPESDRSVSNWRDTPKVAQVGVRVSAAVFARLKVVADDHGQSCAGWVAALLAHVLLDRPLQRRDELVALKEATRQLWSVGVLLNQLARAVNTELKSSGFVRTSVLDEHVIEQCRDEIRSVASAAQRLIETNRQAYRRADHAEEDSHA
jgi:hypothetical protein